MEKKKTFFDIVREQAEKSAKARAEMLARLKESGKTMHPIFGKMNKVEQNDGKED